MHRYGQTWTGMGRYGQTRPPCRSKTLCLRVCWEYHPVWCPNAVKLVSSCAQSVATAHCTLQHTGVANISYWQNVMRFHGTHSTQLSVKLHQPVQRIAELHGSHNTQQHYVQMSDSELKQSNNKYGQCWQKYC
jgi:hypothetical protein